MATAQRMRPPQQKKMKEVSLFPTHSAAGFVSKSKSINFLKRLTATAVSSLVYLRGLFPDDSYKDCMLNGSKIKILHVAAKCEGARKMVSHLHQVFNSLEKGYLKKLEISLYSAPECLSEHLIEQYSFRYAENDLSIHADVQNGRTRSKVPLWLQNCNNTDLEATREYTMDLIRRILLTTSSLHPVPKDTRSYLTVKLFHNEKVTSDYELEGFKNCRIEDSIDPETKESLLQLNLGTIPTPHHGVRVSCIARKANIVTDRDEDLAALDALEDWACSQESIDTAVGARVDEDSTDTSSQIKLAQVETSQASKRNVSRHHSTEVCASSARSMVMSTDPVPTQKKKLSLSRKRKEIDCDDPYGFEDCPSFHGIRLRRSARVRAKISSPMVINGPKKQ